MHGGGYRPLLARWTTDFDCGKETEWWYTIKDTPYNFDELGKHLKKNIRRAMKKFVCYRIDPREYAYQIAEVSIEAFKEYPEKYRPNYTLEGFAASVKEWTVMTWGAFDENGRLCAYCTRQENNGCYSMISSKARPESEKEEVNKLLMHTFLSDISDELLKGKYISNGERNLVHETKHNEDLCEKWGFRKAYCKLHIAYPKSIGIVVKIIFPFRKILKKLGGNNKKLYMVNAVLRMEEIARKTRNEK